MILATAILPGNLAEFRRTTEHARKCRGHIFMRLAKLVSLLPAMVAGTIVVLHSSLIGFSFLHLGKPPVRRDFPHSASPLEIPEPLVVIPHPECRLPPLPRVKYFGRRISHSDPYLPPDSSSFLKPAISPLNFFLSRRSRPLLRRRHWMLSVGRWTLSVSPTPAPPPTPSPARA
jgi:hypothetical protein